MHDIAVVLGLLAVVAALVPLAAWLTTPYPLLLVVGGLILGFIPGLPHVALNPDVVFLLFLPPLIYWSAVTTSFRDFRANLRPIFLLSLGLVITTTCGVAVVAHTVISGMPWAVAFVLGAIVSSTDAIAATAIAQRLGVPERVITIVEGESLVNDASALVTYATAVAAVEQGTFSLSSASAQFVAVSVGGVLIGLAVGWIIAQVRRRIADPLVENTVSLLTPFAAYLPAVLLNVSGVLAVVACGLYIGRMSPVIVSSHTRLQADSIWELANFLLNGLVFILIGLQLQDILNGLTGRPVTTLLWYAAAASLTVMVVRILWVYPATYLPRMLSRRIRVRDPSPSPRVVAIVAWTGMRGVVCLATAQALPYTIHSGAPFPQRDLLIFLTFCVILSTLLVQGLSLPWLIRWLGIAADGLAAQEEREARLFAARAALQRLDALNSNQRAPADILDNLRTHYLTRLDDLTAQVERRGSATENNVAQIYQAVRRDLLNVERQALIGLRNRNVINDAVLRRVQHELDLEDERLDAGLR